MCFLWLFIQSRSQIFLKWSKYFDEKKSKIITRWKQRLEFCRATKEHIGLQSGGMWICQRCFHESKCEKEDIMVNNCQSKKYSLPHWLVMYFKIWKIFNNYHIYFFYTQIWLKLLWHILWVDWHITGYWCI